MILPPALNVGDAIGFFSPSSAPTAFAPKRFARAKAYLADKGFALVAGSLTGRQDYYRSGSIRARVEEINELIRDPRVKCLMSTKGGMNSNALLPYLDYEQLIKTPKIIIGYSDVTALLLGIYARTGLVAFYGPAFVSSFGEWEPIVSRTYSCFAQMFLEVPPLPFTLPTPASWTDDPVDWEMQSAPKPETPNRLLTIRGGSARGRFIGGNLNTMAGIWGTPYMPDIRAGDILLLEDSQKDMETVERSFAHMQLAGVFNRIGGLVLGKHEQFRNMGSGRRPHEILLEVLGEPKFPILAEFDCCHTHPMLTMPLGCDVELDATAQTLTILSDWVQR